MNSEAFRTHILGLTQRYGHVTIVNLLCDDTNIEYLLTQTLESITRRLASENPNLFAYRCFDFHSKCSGQRFYKVNELVENLGEFFTFYKFFSGDENSRQKGVLRTNCLDCLDRTNVVQSHIAWKVLVEQLRAVGEELNPRMEGCQQSLLGKFFSYLWAENADVLSIQYTGAASTISTVTREGKEGFKGLLERKVRSIARFYAANMEDWARQRSIETFLMRKSAVGLVNKIEREIVSREREYCEYRDMTVRVVTWNLGGCALPEAGHLQGLLTSEDPDLLIIALQETVKLNVMSVMFPASSKEALKVAQRTLDIHLAPAYSLVSCKGLVGCALFVYVKQELAGHVYNVWRDSVKLGLRGNAGNKGAVMLRFEVMSTSVCVINCHLKSGVEFNSARKSELLDVLAKGFAKKNYPVAGHRINILCGDLNFRVLLNNRQVRELVHSGNFAEVVAAEQLTQLLRFNAFQDYTEAPVNFPPTYKFDRGTNEYDSSNKRRVPAWCDRVLFKGDLQSTSYGTNLSFYQSDHKPVFASFLGKLKKIDPNRRKELIRNVTREYNFMQ